MRVVLVALASGAILVLGGFPRVGVPSAVSGLAERVDVASDRIEAAASRKAREGSDALKGGAARVVDDARDTLADTAAEKAEGVLDAVLGAVRQATATTLRQASDGLRELASRLQP